MILGRVLGQEPHRSRVFVVAGWVLAAGGSAAMTWTVDRHSLWGLGAVAAAWLLLLIGLATILVRTFIRDFGREPRRGRPMRFALTKRGFGVATLLPGGLVAMMQLFGAGFFVAMLAQWWRDVADPDPAVASPPLVFAVVMTAIVAVIILAAAVTSVAAWPGFVMELTPAGLSMHGPLARRLIPWAALAPGGPPRPQPTAYQLRLVVAQPELVVQRGLLFAWGSRQYPAIPMRVAVDPWFLVDVIRWYAEHPEDRAAIGTESEHQRLIATRAQPLAERPAAPMAEPLAGPPAAPLAEPPAAPLAEPLAGPLAEPPAAPLAEALAGPGPSTEVPRPRPQVVGLAGAFAYAGVAFGVFVAAANLAVAIVFADRLDAIQAAQDAEDRRITGEPVEPMLSGAAFAQVWAVAALVLAVLVGLVAVVLIRLTRRGNAPARIGLAVVSGLVAVWAACPCGTPTLDLTDASDFGNAAMSLWLVQRGVQAALAVTVLVLLLQPAANKYFRVA